MNCPYCNFEGDIKHNNNYCYYKLVSRYYYLLSYYNEVLKAIPDDEWYELLNKMFSENLYNDNEIGMMCKIFTDGKLGRTRSYYIYYFMDYFESNLNDTTDKKIIGNTNNIESSTITENDNTNSSLPKIIEKYTNEQKQNTVNNIVVDYDDSNKYYCIYCNKYIPIPEIYHDNNKCYNKQISRFNRIISFYNEHVTGWTMEQKINRLGELFYGDSMDDAYEVRELERLVVQFANGPSNKSKNFYIYYLIDYLDALMRDGKRGEVLRLDKVPNDCRSHKYIKNNFTNETPINKNIWH